MSLRNTITAFALTALIASTGAFAKPPRNSQAAPQAAQESAEDLLVQGYLSWDLGDSEGATNQFARVLELPHATDAQIVEARLVLALLSEEAGMSQSAIEHLNSLLQVRNVNVEFETAARVMRGRLLMTMGSAAAADDFTAVIDNPNAPVEMVEEALLSRAMVRGAFSDWHGVILDTDRVLIGNSTRPDVIASALAMRGMANKALGNDSAAALELMEAYRMLDLPMDMVQPVWNTLMEMGIDPDAALHLT